MLPDDIVAIIGYSYGIFPELSFLSDANFYEYGTLIVDPMAINFELIQTGGPPFREYAYSSFMRRTEELSTWVSDGHTLILLVRPPIVWVFEFMQDKLLPVSEELSLYEIPVLRSLNFQSASGNRVDYVGPASAESVLQPHLNRLQYQAIINGDQLQPLLQVRRSIVGDSQLIGCVQPFNKGQVICMPLLDGNVDQNAAYLRALADLPVALSSRASPLPDWVDLFRTEQELHCAEAIQKLSQEVRERESQIEQEKVTVADFRGLKTLFAGSGEEFKNSVMAALQELGLKCVDGPHPRADLLASNGSRFLAIEAKGLDGNARERNFRQVERWKAELNSAIRLPPDERDFDPDLKRYAEQLKLLGITSEATDDCKGLMVIGTFRNTPPSKRKMPDFPDGVIRLLAQSNVCALSGLQLFGTRAARHGRIRH